MKIAITGATGHVGAALCRALLAEGHQLRVLYRNAMTGLEGLKIEAVHGDVLDPQSLEDLVKDAEIVFHLAAIISIQGDPDGSVHRINVQGPENVAAACLKQGVRRLIHFSSIHAHQQEPLDQTLDETRPYVGENGYAYDRSKVGGEMAVLKARSQGLEVVIINPTAVIGPYDYRTSLMGQVFRDLYHRRLPSLVEAGFDWVDVRDICKGAIAAIDQGRDGEKYLLSGHWEPIGELARLAEAATGKKAPRFSSPIWLAKMGVPFASLYAGLTGGRPLYTFESLGTLKNSCPHISHQKATDELGYQPRPLEETVRDTYEWLITEGHLGISNTE